MSEIPSLRLKRLKSSPGKSQRGNGSISWLHTTVTEQSRSASRKGWQFNGNRSNRSLEMQQSFIGDETIRLEEELIAGQQKAQQSFGDVKNEIDIYMNYLEDLSILLKHRQAKFGQMLIKGVVGLRQVIRKLPQVNKGISLNKLKFKDSGIQTENTFDFSSDDDVYKLFANDDLAFIVAILKKIDRLGNSRIHARLLELYRTLLRMKQDVPNSSQTPDVIKEDTQNYGDQIQEGLQQVHLGLQNHVFKTIFMKPKGQIQVQTDHPMVHLDDLNQLEQALKEKDRQINQLQIINQKTEQELNHYMDLYRKEQFKFMTLEEQLKQYSSDRHNHPQQKPITQATAVRNATRNLREQFEKERHALKQQLLEKQKKIRQLEAFIQQQEDQLDRTTINWRMAEEKLIQITEAWEKEFGEPFKFKEISEEYLRQKYGIVKRQFRASTPLSGEEQLEGSFDPSSLIANSNQVQNAQRQAMQKLGKNFDPNGHFDENGHFVDSQGRRFDPNRPEGYFDKNGNFIADDRFNPFTQNQRRAQEIGNKKQSSIQGSRHFNQKQAQKRVQAEIDQMMPTTGGKQWWKHSDPGTPVDIGDMDQQKAVLMLENEQILPQDLKKLEAFIRQFERDFVETLNLNQKPKYYFISKAKDRIKELQKYTRIDQNSKGSQFSSNFQQNKKLTIQTKQKQSTIAQSQYDRLTQSPNAKRSRTFKEGDESPTLQALLSRVMMGHDSRCGVDCKHLQRAMAIRAKFYGKPYPVKYQTM